VLGSSVPTSRARGKPGEEQRAQLLRIAWKKRAIRAIDVVPRRPARLLTSAIFVQRIDGRRVGRPGARHDEEGGNEGRSTIVFESRDYEVSSTRSRNNNTYVDRQSPPRGRGRMPARRADFFTE
jgi:hypothetical protein